MKFVVNEMPFWQSDCPFFEMCNCKLDNDFCEYMDSNAGHRDEADCRWLCTKERKDD